MKLKIFALLCIFCLIKGDLAQEIDDYDDSSLEAENVQRNDSSEFRGFGFKKSSWKKSKVSENAHDEDFILEKIKKYVSIIFNTKRNLRYTLKAGDTNWSTKLKGFDPKKETKIVIHGYNSNSQFCNGFRKAYIRYNFDVNFFCIDWGYLSKALSYVTPDRSAALIGQYLGANIISKYLIKTLKQSARKIHIIGHGFGAHLAGSIGQATKKSGWNTIARITALDPSIPKSTDPSEVNIISKFDARLVDVIHTEAVDSNSGYKLNYGISEPLGHADFYPNGGNNQRGCWTASNPKCSHQRAYTYYIESISRNPSKKFLSTACTSYDYFKKGYCKNANIPMGEGFSSRNLFSKGDNVFYLSTNGRRPYSKSG